MNIALRTDSKDWSHYWFNTVLKEKTNVCPICGARLLLNPEDTIPYCDLLHTQAEINGVVESNKQ